MDNHLHEHISSHTHRHSLYDELVCHLPYAIYAVSLSLALLSFLTLLYFRGIDPHTIHKISNALFHNFHFMHIVFAGMGVMITYGKYSQNWPKGILLGSIIATFFCVLSDILMPYVGGRFLGAPMDLHICFLKEFRNITPFLIVGISSGTVMSQHHLGRQTSYSVISHFVHIFISSLASMFYLVGHGFLDWHKQIGMIFTLLLLAVVIPCTLSDIVVPLLVAKDRQKR